MGNLIKCSVGDAIKLMEHMDKDDIVLLAIVNRKTHGHKETKKIKKEKGEKYVLKAETICYEDNDFFGRLSLGGVTHDKNVIHSVLFPQNK